MGVTRKVGDEGEGEGGGTGRETMDSCELKRFGGTQKEAGRMNAI